MSYEKMSNTPGGQQQNVQDKMASAMESAKEAAQNVTTKVADFFQGNPFDTPVGKKIGEIFKLCKK